MSAFFDIRNLVFERGNFKLHVPNLQIEKGEIHLLMGPSGSGKSTVLHSVAGFLDGLTGEICVGGKNILGLPPELRQVGYVFQQGALFPNMNVLENVGFALRVRGVPKAEREKRATGWLERVGLNAHAEKRVDQISGGEAQRVQLARSLIGQFPVLLLDEPFSALDVDLKEDLRKLVRELVRETRVACLLVSHDPVDAKSIADRLSFIEKGTVTKTEKARNV